MLRLELEYPNIWLYEDDRIRQEVFWPGDEDSDADMRADGFFPLEELFPGQHITGYEAYDTLYAEKREREEEHP